MSNPIIAVKSYLKEALPREMDNRVSCVNVLLMLYTVQNESRAATAHEVVEMLSVFGEEIKHSQPMSVSECKQLLDELVRLKFVKKFGNGYFLSESLQSGCLAANNEAGFDDE